MNGLKNLLLILFLNLYQISCQTNMDLKSTTSNLPVPQPFETSIPPPNPTVELGSSSEVPLTPEDLVIKNLDSTLSSYHRIKVTCENLQPRFVLLRHNQNTLSVGSIILTTGAFGTNAYGTQGDLSITNSSSKIAYAKHKQFCIRQGILYLCILLLDREFLTIELF